MTKKSKKADLIDKGKIEELIREFIKTCEPLEKDRVVVLEDACTNATYCECHISAKRLILNGTINVALDPEQQEYRANREVVEDHIAFEKMKEDALNKRAFSNIVAEFVSEYDPKHPLKIIGGQHRYLAIEEALKKGIDENHGVKLYFGLNTDQRLDVQLISNTNIAASTDLYDRMYETVSGPELRNWCHDVGLLLEGKDFADRRKHGQLVTVRAARTFILNYYKGKEIDPQKLDHTESIPVLADTGGKAEDWENFKKRHPKWFNDGELKKAGTEFAALCEAQHRYISSLKKVGRVNIDYAEKALNYAVLSAWALVAGMLHANKARLERHFKLSKITKIDPLNASALAEGSHKTDPSNYRGLGYRTGPKERGRLVELFYLNTERGEGITKGLVELAIKLYHAKEAVLEAQEARARVE